MLALPEYAYVTPLQKPTENDAETTSATDLPLADASSSRHSQSDDYLAIPGTSYEIRNSSEEAGVGKESETPTPSKLLNNISAIPTLKKKTTLRGKAARVSKVLNSEENIKLQKAMKSRPTTNGNLDKPRAKRSRIRRRESDTSDSECSLNGDDDVYNDSDDDFDEWNENVCTGCGEDYNATKSTEDWILCPMCSCWLHENCTKYGTMCDLCGKRKSKTKNCNPK